MEILALVIAIIASFYAGLRYRVLRDSISKITVDMKDKLDKEKPDEKKSELIDPYDPIHKAQEEHNEMMERLNPGSYENR